MCVSAESWFNTTLTLLSAVAHSQTTHAPEQSHTHHCYTPTPPPESLLREERERDQQSRKERDEPGGIFKTLLSIISNILTLQSRKRDPHFLTADLSDLYLKSHPPGSNGIVSLYFIKFLYSSLTGVSWYFFDSLSSLLHSSHTVNCITTMATHLLLHILQESWKKLLKYNKNCYLRKSHSYILNYYNANFKPHFYLGLRFYFGLCGVYRIIYPVYHGFYLMWVVVANGQLKKSPIPGE